MANLDDPNFATGTNYSSGPYSGSANKSRPASGNITEGFDPGAGLPAEWLNYELNLHGVWIGSIIAAMFGDGSDGDMVLDGSNTYSGMTLVSNTYTLTRDIYANSISITNIAQIVPAGFRIYCRNTFSNAGNGVKANGGLGGIPTGGTAATTGVTTGSSTAGGNGGSPGNPGAAGGNVTSGLGGAGGAGTAGAGGAGGAGGTVTAVSSSFSNTGRAYNATTFGCYFTAPTFTFVNAGAGGGGGGGDSSVNSGPGGGGGGGVIAIAARNIVLDHASALSASGGSGNNGSGGAGHSGGGGGGVVMLVYSTITVSSGTLNGATCCPGGTAGSGATNGSNGNVVQIQLNF